MTGDTAHSASPESLRALAEAALAETKGRWQYRRSIFPNDPRNYAYVEWGAKDEGYGTATLSVTMARYLAALDPRKVIALLDRAALQRDSPAPALTCPKCGYYERLAGPSVLLAAAPSEPPARPPVPQVPLTHEQAAVQFGLRDRLIGALGGRFSTQRRNALANRLVMVVARWREGFRDCGCWRTEDGFSLCDWHEELFRPQRGEAERLAMPSRFRAVRQRLSRMAATEPRVVYLDVGSLVSFEGASPQVVTKKDGEFALADPMDVVP